MRILVLSDIHSNIVALEAVLADAPPADETWVTGDIVGYGPEPDAVVERLRELRVIAVRGNHDVAALGGDEIDYFNEDARRAMLWTRSAIADTTRTWLASLPERITRGSFTLAHGSPRDPVWEYVTTTPVARASFEAMATDHGVIGHTHRPAAFLNDDGVIDLMAPAAGSVIRFGKRRVLLNSGSVGQPRDGIPTASWMILDTAEGAATWHRTPYDIASVQAAMQRAGLPRFLRDRLAYGG
jgi:predicted phosphodiesterase